jgi:hypothetical protein
MGDRLDNRGEHGQILILFALSLVVILAFAAIVIDLGVLRNNRQILVNALDAGALAGGYNMPIDGTAGTPTTVANVEKLITDTITATYRDLPSSAYQITYRCVIGVDSSNNPFASRDVPLVCDPHYSLKTTVSALQASPKTYFKGAGPTRASSCDPTAGDKCNTVVVTGAATTPFSLGGVVGVTSGSTGTVSSAACQGPCGASPSVPLDLVVIVDRTASMSCWLHGQKSGPCDIGSDVLATKDASKAVLQVYDPNFQRVAFGLLGPSSTTSACSGSPTGVYGQALTSSTGYGTVLPVLGNPGNLKNWIPIGFTGTDSDSPPMTFNEPYAANGVLNPGSHIVAAINCFDNPGGTGTNLAVPIRMAKAYLDLSGRPGVPWGILLETDGQPSFGVGTSADYTCAQADADATLAKTDAKAVGGGIEIFTVGFGLDGSNNVACPDTSWKGGGKKARDLLASMATQPSVDGGCPGTSNSDHDHFFCEPKTTDLTAVFTTVATTFAHTGAKLLRLYPPPVVTSVSPAGGSKSGNFPVFIGGSYFTGVTKVQFGGTPAAITNVTDTSITVTAPAGAANSTVDVIVTTGGGSSPMTSADHFTYGP